MTENIMFFWIFPVEFPLICKEITEYDIAPDTKQ